jgi:hypothetical protein
VLHREGCPEEEGGQADEGEEKEVSAGKKSGSGARRDTLTRPVFLFYLFFVPLVFFCWNFLA